MKATFRWRIVRGDRVVAEGRMRNTLTQEGIEDLCTGIWSTLSGTRTCYFGVIDDSGFTGVDVTDTMAAHSGWTELDLGTRRAASASIGSGEVDASGSGNFTAATACTARGLFICRGDSTEGGSSGKLWCAAEFNGGAQALLAGDTLSVSYSFDGTVT